MPYDKDQASPSDAARAAVHPAHLRDILLGLQLLRDLSLRDRTYPLTGHSAGACLAFQATLPKPAAFDIVDVAAPPIPAAVFGINGLYDLPGLVDNPGPRHEGVAAEYVKLLSRAFGDRRNWAGASPSRLDATVLEDRVRRELAPRLASIPHAEAELINDLA